MEGPADGGGCAYKRAGDPAGQLCTFLSIVQWI